MSEWFRTSGLGFSQVQGASLDFLGEKGYLIGGSKVGGEERSPWLQMDQIVLPGAEWKPSVVNTGGLLNRAYHATAAIQASKKLYVFGGEIAEDSDRPYPAEVIEVETKSLFGLKASIYTPAGDSGAVAVKGLTAAVVGKSVNEHVATFGGKNSEGGCSDDLWLFTPLSAEQLTIFSRAPVVEGEDGEAEGEEPLEPPTPWIKLTCSEDEEKPCPRYLHTCVSAGPNKDLLILYGGQNEAGDLLSDVWMCDLSEVVTSMAPPVQCEDGDAEEKNGGVETQEISTTVKWTKLRETSETVGPRFKHQSFCYMTPKQDGSDPDPCIYLNVFGGTSSKGSCDGKVWTSTINLSPEVVEPDEEGNGGCDGSPQASDFACEKSASQSGVPLSDLNGCCIGTICTDSVPTALVLAVDGLQSSLQVVDDMDDLSLATKKECIRKVKEAKAAAAAQASDSQSVEEESVGSSGLPKRVTYPNGDIYEGSLKLPGDYVEGDPIVPTRLVRNGRGTMTYADTGEVYVGQWSVNQRVGYGKSEVDGTIYDGAYEDDLKHGEGTLRKKPEPVDEGAAAGTAEAIGGGDVSQLGTANNSVDDIGNVQGSIADAEELELGMLIYDGNWVAGVYHGDGVLVYDNGDRYTGTFKNGKRHGKGSLEPSKPDGTRYVGDWVDGEISGLGEVKNYPVKMEDEAHNATPHPEGQEPCSGLYEGQVRNGIPWGKQGYVRYSDGSEYLGEWINGKRNGYGKHVMPNLDEYEGKFVGGLRCGFGRLICTSGENYFGNWKDNHFSGEGQRTAADGTQEVGNFDQTGLLRK